MRTTNYNINEMREDRNNTIVLDYNMNYRIIESRMQSILSQIGLSVYGYNNQNSIYWGKLFDKNKCICSLYLHININSICNTQIVIENKTISNHPIIIKIIEKINNHINEINNTN
jgi:hypothetical protein